MLTKTFSRKVCDERIGGADRSFGPVPEALREGLGKLRAHPGRQRRGKEDGAAPQGRMEAEQRTEQAVNISVAGVHLIDDQHLATEAEEPHRLMSGGEDGEESLIDRPDTDVSQERLLPTISQPVRALPGAGFLAWTETSFDAVLVLHCERHAA